MITEQKGRTLFPQLATLTDSGMLTKGRERETQVEGAQREARRKQLRKDEAAYLRRSGAVRLMKIAAGLLSKVHTDVTLSMLNPELDDKSTVDVRLAWGAIKIGRQPEVWGKSYAMDIYEWNEATVRARRDLHDETGQIIGI